MPTLEELQSPSSAKLSAQALREIRREQALWRDRIIAARPEVEERIGAGAWPAVLEIALNGSIVDWLCSLAVPAASAPAVSHKPAPARRPQSNSTTGIRGVTKKRGGYQARLVVNKERHNLGTHKTPELAAKAIDEFLAERT